MQRRSGFTLIELAVVLVVIGLILGGVLAGQSVIRSAQINRVLSDATQYRTVINQFKDQYEYLPGDYPNAVDAWGDDTTLCSDGNGTNNGTPGACNGNGNGLIDYTAANNAAVASGTAEAFQVWRQLTLAGYLSGAYSGANGPNAAQNEAIAGVNSPSTALKASTFWIYSGWGMVPADSGVFYAGDYFNLMVFGGQRLASWPQGGIMTAAEAQQLDTKGDDGYPGLGSIRMMSASWADANIGYGCVTNDNGQTARYRLDVNEKVCILLFMNTFSAPLQSKL